MTASGRRSSTCATTPTSSRPPLRSAIPPSPYWYGADPATAAHNFDTFYAKGWAPIWEMMGKGKWATDPNYAGKVIGLYERIATHAIGG